MLYSFIFSAMKMLQLALAFMIIAILSIVDAENCSADALPPSLGPSGGDLVALALTRRVQGVIQSTPMVTILDYHIVCLTTSRVIGQYAWASVVINYTCSGVACPIIS